MIKHCRVALRYRTGLPSLPVDDMWPPPVCADAPRDFYAETDHRGEATGLELRRWCHLSEREAALAFYEEGG